MQAFNAQRLGHPAGQKGKEAWVVLGRRGRTVQPWHRSPTKRRKGLATAVLHPTWREAYFIFQTACSKSAFTFMRWPVCHHPDSLRPERSESTLEQSTCLLRICWRGEGISRVPGRERQHLQALPLVSVPWTTATDRQGHAPVQTVFLVLFHPTRLLNASQRLNPVLGWRNSSVFVRWALPGSFRDDLDHMERLPYTPTYMDFLHMTPPYSCKNFLPFVAIS